jgi:colanic acid biosynthesis glycosyl transferase WcaI
MNSRPKVLFLNRSYWPDVEATGQLLTELCESLQPTFDVSVVAGQPNQIRDTNEDIEWQNEPVRHGVRIHRIAHSRFSKSRMLLKALNYVSFVRATRRFLRTCDTPDVVVFETDPFLLPFEAQRLKKRTGCRMVGYLQDIYPDVAVALGKVPNNWMIRRLRESLFSIYRSCDRMVVLSEDMKRLLISGGVNGDKIDIVPNWADPDVIRPLETSHFRVSNGLNDRFVVMYSGNLGLTQRLEEFMAAAELLYDMPQVVFTFVGQGSQRQSLQNLVHQKNLTNVRFFDYQPKSELAQSLNAADLHLVPLTRELSQCLMPSKLYGILAAGRPYLTNAPAESELARLTREYRVGMTVEPGCPKAIADGIRAAANDHAGMAEMGKNARKLAISEFSREKSAEKFRDVLKTALNTH